MYQQAHSESPATIWRRFITWAVLALVALVGALALTGLARYSGMVLLGWALGVVVAASLILFRQPG